MDTLVIAGDFSPAATLHPLFERSALADLFGSTLPLFRFASHAVVNLECALTSAETPIRKFGPNLKAPPVCASVLKEAGFTICSLSNNHVFDYGEKGLHDTMDALDQANLQWLGAGDDDTQSRQPFFGTLGAKTFALIAVCEHEYTYALKDRIGANPYDPYDTMEDIREAKKKADAVIVLYHGGKEHCEYPSPRLQKLCRAMALNGADAVLCQHSHCIGCYENYEGSHLLYGQGNFHFLTEFSRAPQNSKWHTGLLCMFTLGERLELTFEPVVSTPTGITLAQGEQRAFIQEGLQARSNNQSGQWEDGWKRFCGENREQYESTVCNALAPGTGEREREHFAHYLDCEAHTDVWRELFSTWHKNKRGIAQEEPSSSNNGYLNLKT